ncbi:MAG: spore coat associated protein CotJA [Firmicutes bacterium]|nr:spore coat associated protein CotJA [Bacillota bacterium]
MYKCRYCGFVTHIENAVCCTNPDCSNYCGRYEAEQARSAPVRPASIARQVSDAGSLGFATVPFQKFESVMPPGEALAAGTVFSALNMPYDKKIIRRG